MKCEIKCGNAPIQGIIAETIEIPLSSFREYCESDLQLAMNMICSNINGLNGGATCSPLNVCGSVFSVITEWAQKYDFDNSKHIVFFVPEQQSDQPNEYYPCIALIDEKKCHPIVINDQYHISLLRPNGDLKEHIKK